MLGLPGLRHNLAEQDDHLLGIQMKKFSTGGLLESMSFKFTICMDIIFNHIIPSAKHFNTVFKEVLYNLSNTVYHTYFIIYHYPQVGGFQSLVQN